jgi:transglutaminase-like putative cysteine protease
VLIDARGIAPSRWPALLEHLVQASVRERRSGTPTLGSTHVIYQREPDRREIWQSAQSTHELGHGDCEDLAIWLCADARVAGIPCRVVVKPVRPGLRHALVLAGVGRASRLFDPSLARGMKGPG